MDRLKNRLDAYERLVESQEKTIELLEMQLRNERLKNNNLSSLFKAGDGIKSIEDLIYFICMKIRVKQLSISTISTS